jgi:tetratricopeptide (TPR) repeat protein
MLVTWVLAIAAVVAALFLGRGVLSWGARKMAALEMSAGAIRGAQQWLAWSSWLDSSNGETELMQAACARHLEDVERWREAITSAERKGAPATRMQQEIMLGEIRSGEVHGQSEDPLGALLDAGVPPHEVCAAFVHGYLLRGEPDKAKMVLDAWSADMPDDAHLGYMKGVYWRHLSELGRARTEFENTLARQPRHQLARAALAELLETDDRLEEAFAQYVALATRSSANETTKVALGRILRKSGRLAEARAVLESFA